MKKEWINTREKDAERLGLKYFRLWAEWYDECLKANNLKHNDENMFDFYYEVVLVYGNDFGR